MADDSDEWKTASEWAALSLPGVPGSKQGFSKRAKSKKWGPTRQRKGRGGGTEYHVSALPAEAKRELTLRKRRDLGVQPTPSKVKMRVLSQNFATLSEMSGKLVAEFVATTRAGKIDAEQALRMLAASHALDECIKPILMALKTLIREGSHV